MSSVVMTFPDTVEEFMEQYKIVDREQVYTNGAELVPIFRMKQWFEHIRDFAPTDHGDWKEISLRWFEHFEPCKDCQEFVCEGCSYEGMKKVTE